MINNVECNAEETKTTAKKRVKPKKDILYTFTFDGVKRTFKFVDVHVNGQYIFKDTKQKTPSLMTPARFSCLYKNALVGEKQLDEPKNADERAKNKKSNNSAPAKNTAPTGEQNAFNIAEMVSKILSLSDVQNKRLLMLVGKDKTDIATDIETRLLTAEEPLKQEILKDYNTAIKITTV